MNSLQFGFDSYSCCDKPDAPCKSKGTAGFDNGLTSSTPPAGHPDDRDEDEPVDEERRVDEAEICDLGVSF